METPSNHHAQEIDALTPAERSVLEAIRECRHTASAADRLGISLHTLRTHLRNIRAKLGVHSTMEAILLRVDDNL